MNKQVNTIEPCLREAKVLVAQLQAVLTTGRHQQFRHIFTALADDDPAVGLLAYYLWRKRAQHQKPT